MTQHLIVTADDFGLSSQVNEAVEAAHRDGILTAASLMVGAPAADDAVRLARALPELRVGLHLALVEAKPLLPLAQVPDLIGPDGWFRRDTARFGAEIFFRPSLERQVAREIEAQFEAYAATGLPLDHVDAHQHFHLHPTIAGLMIRIGRRFGMRAVRIPAEPTRIIRAIDPKASRAIPSIVAPWTALLGRRLRRAGYCVPDQVFGLAWTGAMTAERIESLIERLPEGITEIYTHPAIDGDYPGAAPGYRYAEELGALVAPRVRAAVERRRVTLGGYADVISSQAASADPPRGGRAPAPSVLTPSGLVATVEPDRRANGIIPRLQRPHARYGAPPRPDPSACSGVGP